MANSGGLGPPSASIFAVEHKQAVRALQTKLHAFCPYYVPVVAILDDQSDTIRFHWRDSTLSRHQGMHLYPVLREFRHICICYPLLLREFSAVSSAPNPRRRTARAARRGRDHRRRA